MNLQDMPTMTLKEMTKQLEAMTPGMRAVIAQAVTGATYGDRCCSDAVTQYARGRLDEALTTWLPANAHKPRRRNRV